MSEPEHFQEAPTDADLLPVVDESDRETGALPRREVHLRRLLHRAVQIVVLDGEGRVWLQQRSRHKDSYPGYWDLSATGHVDPGESYAEAARRELREELGLEAEPEFVGKIEACAFTGWEFQAIYWLRWVGDLPNYNRDEIEQLRRFTLAEIRQAASAPAASPWPLTPCVPAHLPRALAAAGIEFHL